MNDSRLAKGRRSTRLFISIPIVITGKDVNRKEFQEKTVRMALQILQNKL